MQLSERNMQAELDRAAQQSAPGPETYEAILREVTQRAGTGEKLSYAVGTARVEQMHKRQRRRRRNTATIGAGCLVAAACLGFYMMPRLNSNINPDDGMVAIEDAPIPLGSLPEGLDLQIERVLYADGLLVLRLNDQQDRIDWQSIYGIDEHGEVFLPLELDREQGLVTFAHPDGNLTVHANDTDGNPLF